MQGGHGPPKFLAKPLFPAIRARGSLFAGVSSSKIYAPSRSLILRSIRSPLLLLAPRVLAPYSRLAFRPCQSGQNSLSWLPKGDLPPPAPNHRKNAMAPNNLPVEVASRAK